MSKTEETELLGGEQPVSAVIIHTNWKGTFKQTAGPDSENADPLTITKTSTCMDKSSHSSQSTRKQLARWQGRLTIGAWILKVTSFQASLGPLQPTSWAICSRDLRLRCTLLPWPTKYSTGQSWIDGISAYIVSSALPTFCKWGMFRAKLSKSERERNLNAKPKTKTNKTKHLADNKPGNGRYLQALMEITAKLKETACKPFPRLQFLSEGKRGAWFVEQEPEMVTHKVAHLPATEG